VTLGEVMAIYTGSDGDATSAMYMKLHARGTLGFIAANLFRAVKSSERAKIYRARGYKTSAYERKQWSLANLARALQDHAEEFDITWGWSHDDRQAKHNRVLYVDLPEGQVSFHTDHREVGPNYAGEWDGKRGMGAQRVCALAVRVLALPPVILIHQGNTEPTDAAV